MNKIFYVIVIFMFLSIALTNRVYAFGLVKIAVKVCDENGSPIEQAALKIRFSSNSKPEYSTTNSSGVSLVTSSSDDGVIVGEVAKDGFYKSVFHHDFYAKKFGTWQPWGKELTVVMRPIINPVPMYVRNTSFEIPAVDKEIGFDLMKADWVIPYGQGTQSDFIIKFERMVNSFTDFDATLTMTFPNKYDGIQLYKENPGGDFDAGSWYRLLRNAPIDGYQEILTKQLSSSSPDFYALKAGDENYFFRVRSEVDTDGKLIRAMYGKIRGEIVIEPRSSKIGKIFVHYYLNPDYTRNLEFDPKRNLFSITSPGENVLAP